MRPVIVAVKELIKYIINYLLNAGPPGLLQIRYFCQRFLTQVRALNDIGVVIIRLNNERSFVAFYVTDFALQRFGTHVSLVRTRAPFFWQSVMMLALPIFAQSCTRVLQSKAGRSSSEPGTCSSQRVALQHPIESGTFRVVEL